MKNITIIFLIITVSILIVSCKDVITDPPPVLPQQEFFPAGEGLIYHYNVFVYDPDLVHSGTMKSYYGSETTIQSVPYQTKTDTLQLDNSTTDNISHFRKSNSGVFYFVDTTGISEIVPDSLRNFVDIDLEYRLLYQPLETTQTWPVFRIQVAGLGINILSIDAKSVLKDSIDIALPNIQAKKLVHQVHYSAVITVAQNEPPLTFEAFAWFAEDIGIIKWEGEAELLNFLFGSGIFLDGSYIILQLNYFSDGT